MKLQELDGADFSLVEIVDGYPYCKVHGAMNQVSKGGVWRCISQYKWVPCFSKKGVETPPKLVENVCRAGCVVEEDVCELCHRPFSAGRYETADGICAYCRERNFSLDKRR